MNKRSTGRLFTLLACGLAVGLMACSDNEAVREVAVIDPEVVAEVGNRRVTVAEVKEYIASRASAGGGAAAAHGVTSLVEEMIIAESLQQEALRQGLEKKPEVQRTIRQILTQRLLDEQVTKPVATRQIQDAELKAYFERHRAQYSWPEQVRVADIFIAVSEGASSTERDAGRQRAEALLGEALETKGQRFGFSELMHKHSDEHPKFSLGDTGFFDREGKPAGLDANLVQAAFSLERNGELYANVIETGLGFHVIMRVGHRSSVFKTHKDVAEELVQRIRREELAQKRSAYISSVREGASVRINDQAIAVLAAELGVPSAERVSGAVGSDGAAPPPLPGKR